MRYGMNRNVKKKKKKKKKTTTKKQTNKKKQLRIFGHSHPAKIQIRLRIRAIRSESSLGTFWIAKVAKIFHADIEDSDQTTRMRKLLWAVVRHTSLKVRFLTLRLRYP